MKRSAVILTATIGLLTLTSACTPAEVRHYIKAVHVRPATETVVEIGTPLAPIVQNPAATPTCNPATDTACAPVGEQGEINAPPTTEYNPAIGEYNPAICVPVETCPPHA